MDQDRRRVLGTTALAIAGALAGCAETDQQGTEDGSPTGGETPNGTTAPGTTDRTAATEPETDTPTETDAPTEAETETPDDTPTETDTPAETKTATATPDEPLTPTETVALTIDNEGFTAWKVTEDESGQVAEIEAENPTITFETGVRYTVQNNGWSFHPFALRASDDSPLLSQDAEGRYEDDRDVNWVDDGNEFAFTLTEALAADTDYYICTVHSSMRGDTSVQ
ncbi:hypothetical protein [Halorientalis pallida]|uniref:Uncharacterized protein n=1 Tax=Halorientalis pallida TaxID=2479928 RepID=A0A498L0W1_9EURY|nr:hypothetical protein [Halorientalis pallida]RXK51959.1 hypothetical protein EAF64_04815 [Halorientalis pallida]